MASPTPGTHAEVETEEELTTYLTAAYHNGCCQRAWAFVAIAGVTLEGGGRIGGEFKVALELDCKTRSNGNVQITACKNHHSQRADHKITDRKQGKFACSVYRRQAAPHMQERGEYSCHKQNGGLNVPHILAEEDHRNAGSAGK